MPPSPTPPRRLAPRPLRPLILLGRPRWSALAACVLTVLAISPMVVVVASFAGDPVVPRSDLAVFDLRARDVFSADPPLVGPFGDGWNHPGPAAYLVPALVGAAFGWPAWATFVGGALVQATAIVWLAIAAWRRGGLPLLAVVLGGLGLAYSVQGPWVVTDPWNPHLAYPFFALFVFQVWSIGEGSAWAWVGGAITGSFLAQTHIGYAPLVATGLAFALVTTLRRASRPPPLSRALPVAAVAVLGLWLLPLVEQVTESPGNLSQLARYFLGGGPAIGFRRGAELMAGELTVPPPWLSGARIDLDTVVAGASAAWLILPVLGLAATGLLARRRRDARGARLVALAGSLLVAGVVALARLNVETTWWRVMWRTPVAVLVVLAVAVVLVAAAGEPWRGRLRAWGVVALGFAVPLGFGGLAVDVARVDRGGSPMGGLLDAASGIEGPVTVVELGRRGRHGAFPAVVDELDRTGVEVRVEPGETHRFGEHRRADEATPVLGFTEHGQVATYAETSVGGRVVARTTPLAAEEERELRSLEVVAISALEAAGNLEALDQLALMDSDELAAEAPTIDAATALRLAALSRKAYDAGCRCALVELPGDAAREMG